MGRVGGRVRSLAGLGRAKSCLAIAGVVVLGFATDADAKSVAPCGSPLNLEPTYDLGVGEPPLIVGDSAIGFASPYLQFVGYRINGRGCRTFNRGVNALAAEAKARPLPELVVIALGTGGVVKEKWIRKAVDIVGPDRTLALMTPRRFFGGIDPDAATIRAATRKFGPNVVLVDWARHSTGHDEWFVPDLVHPNEVGAVHLTLLLERLLIDEGLLATSLLEPVLGL